MNNSTKTLALVALLITASSFIQATNYTVPDSASIQIIIDSSANGDTIYVEGNHIEQIVVNKEISLIASGSASIDGGGNTGTIISIEASNVTIDGFNISNIVGFGISTKNAGEVGLTNLTIKNNNITNIQAYSDLWESGVGIFLGYMDGYFIYDNGTLSQSGLVAELNYAGLIVDNNTISNIAEGIVAQSIHGGAGTELQFTNNSVSDTTIGRNGGAFYIDSSSYITIDNNISNNAYFGINMSSYLFNIPWVEYNTTGGSHHIYITNNEFTNSKSAGTRDDGAGITIYGGQVSTMLISGNNLSNNSKHAILLAANDSISAPYNYFGNSTNDVIAKSAINRQRVNFDTAGATINTDPYYYTRTKNRDSSSSVTTGDNNATISYTMQEVLSNTTRVSGTITIGTGSSTIGVASENLVYGTNVTHGNLGYTGSTTLSNLDMGSYNYEINYITSEGIGITNTGNFDILLTAYGCVTQTYHTPYIYFNTDYTNVDMTDPDELDLKMYQVLNGREYDTPRNPGDSFTFNFQKLGTTNLQSLTIQESDTECSFY